MRFQVEILDNETPWTSKLLERYEIDAPSLEAARTLGLERFAQEHPDRDMDVVHGKAAPPCHQPPLTSYE